MRPSRLFRVAAAWLVLVVLATVLADWLPIRDPLATFVRKDEGRRDEGSEANDSESVSHSPDPCLLTLDP